MKKFSAFEISRVIFFDGAFYSAGWTLRVRAPSGDCLISISSQTKWLPWFPVFVIWLGVGTPNLWIFERPQFKLNFFCRHSNKKQSNPVLQGKPFEFEKEKKIRGTRRAKKRPTLVRRSFFRAASKEFRPPLSPPLLLPHKQYRERGRLCVIPPTLPPSRCTLYQFYLYLLVVERRLDVAAVVVVVSVQHSPTPCCALTQGQLFSK